MKHLKFISLSIILLACISNLFAVNSKYIGFDDAPNDQDIPESLLKVVSIDLKNVSCEEALSEIEKKGDFKLNYNRNRITIDQKISVKMNSVPLLKPLLKILNDTGSGLTIAKGGQLAIVPVSKSLGMISGIVKDKNSGKPLAGVNVNVLENSMGASTTRNGEFMIRKVPTGIYTLEATMMGYASKKIKDIPVTENESVKVDFVLADTLLSLPAIIVTPGSFAIMGKQPVTRQILTYEDLQTVTFGEDVYRAITRLPGVSASDFSAKFTVRGGEYEEVLVLLDGLEIYEPFHLKDIEGGALSIVDVEAIEGIDLLTGGFSAEYGDRMSGVFNIKSKDAKVGKNKSSLGISLMNARFMSQGSFNEGKGSYFLSARRGYLDLVLKLMKENEEDDTPPEPKYYDLFGKIKYDLNKNHSFSFNLLQAGDKLNYIEDDQDEDNTEYGNTYGWLTLNSFISPKLFVRSLFSIGNVSHDRRGIGYDEGLEFINFTVRDKKRSWIIGAKQDWHFELSDRFYLKWGIDYKKLNADYEYLNTKKERVWNSEINYYFVEDTLLTQMNPSGNKFATYFSNKFRLWSPLTTEVGLRYDYTSYANDDLFSPRINFVYSLGKKTFLRAGWGHFYQSQGIHEIKVAYGEKEFFPAELAKHTVAGIEHTFNNGVNFRLEGYYKKMSDLKSEYRNWPNDIEIFPEMYEHYKLHFNGATSKGIEAFAKYDQGGKFTWYLSYALAYANEKIRSLNFEGVEYIGTKEEYPGRYDQRHTVYIDLNYRLNRNWQINLAWQYHSSWPYTEMVMRSFVADGETYYYSTYGDYNQKNYPAYHRMDLRINRHFYLAKGQVSLYLAIINLYNRENVRNYDYNWQRFNAAPYLQRESENWFKLLPSIGINWSWDH